MFKIEVVRKSPKNKKYLSYRESLNVEVRIQKDRYPTDPYLEKSKMHR